MKLREAALLEQQLSFRLSTDEHRRLRKLIYPFLRSRTISAILVCLYGSIFVTTILQNHHTFWGRVFTWSAAVACGIYMLSFIQLQFQPRRLAVEGSLSFSQAGFAGSLDGSDVAIPWSDIAAVRSLDDAIVVQRRRGLGAVAILKADIPNIAALWAAFDDRLVSKRGLIRPTIARTYINNSAC